MRFISQLGSSLKSKHQRQQNEQEAMEVVSAVNVTRKCACRSSKNKSVSFGAYKND